MKASGVAVQAALAGVGLVAAYLTWQRPSDVAADAVTVVDATRAAVERVRYETAEGWVEVRPDRTLEDSAWVRTSAVVPEESTQSAEDAGTPPRVDAKKATPERELRGGEGARSLLNRFAPMTASRSLGVLPEDKLEELGLAQSAKRLSVETAGGQRSFLVSTKVLGASNPYVRDERSGEVFLLGPGIVSDFEAASTRLVDRRLHAFRPGDFDALRVEQGARSREFTVSGKPPQDPKLTPTSGEGSGEPDAFAGSWHGRLWRLVPTELYGKEEVPEGITQERALKVTYFNRGKELGFLEVMRGEEDGIFARSERTAGWVKLHGTNADVIEEVKKIAP